MGLLALIPLNTHILDPIKLALKDFDYNDLAYSRMGKNEKASMDTNIVIVDIGSGQRKEIAALLDSIYQSSPRVVGVDITFNERREPATDSALHNLISNKPNLVLAYHFTGESVKAPVGVFYSTAREKGFTNFVGEEGGIIRYFAPRLAQGSQNYEAFATSIVKLANPEQYQSLVERDNQTEMISYVPRESFLVIDGMGLLRQEVSFSFKDKIVLLGLAQESTTNVEDKHFTPMNKKTFGKSLPDLEGVFIHANIVKMINDGSYIVKMPRWLTWLVAVILCWMHMGFFLSYFIERHRWFHLASKIAQLLSFILFVYLGLLLFYNFDFKVNLTPALLAIILAVDVLYFYEAIAKWLHLRWGFKTVFTQTNHH